MFIQSHIRGIDSAVNLRREFNSVIDYVEYRFLELWPLIQLQLRAFKIWNLSRYKSNDMRWQSPL